MPASLRSALPLLRGAGCFSADVVESLGNCSLRATRASLLLEPHIDFWPADDVHLRPIDGSPQHYYQILCTAPAKCAAHFPAVIESTCIVLVLAFRVPVTLTFFPTNFSGVRWSLSV